MPAFLNWLLRLGVTNPIVMRLVYVGSRQPRHLYIRAGYLAVMILTLLLVLLGQNSLGTLSLRELAGAGANMFNYVSYLQVALICLLTPVFMAGAIAQEANPKTWEILLTTPLNNLQLVLGNLIGRLFFVIALLFSSLPLFVMTQYFGGVPGSAIFSSYAVAAASAIVVAAIAITLSVTRTAGRRAVFIFYASVIMYIVITYGLDVLARTPVPGSTQAGARFTTFWTPLNPFLALEVLLNSNMYVVHDFTGTSAGFFRQMWYGRPLATYGWLCGLVSTALILWSTLRLRVIGARTGSIPWYRRLFGLGAKGATERPPRKVGHNPIVWRESVARGKTIGALLGRWGFVTAGVIVALIVIALYHTGSMDHSTFRVTIASIVAAELIVITLAALNMSATTVSREREDGSLDIILTTPIQPGPYLLGKLVGLLQFLLPMILVPSATLGLVAIYILFDGFGRENGVMVTDTGSNTTTTFDLPVILPEGALILPFVLIPFLSFCVMVGLQWSIKSKGTISSVIATVGVTIVVIGAVSLCSSVAGDNMSHVGAALATLSPITLVQTIISPADVISDALDDGIGPARMALAVGAAITAFAYGAISFGMHANMKRTFMMTVRKLAGRN